MEVQLYIYDLSRGLARQLSLPLLGIQLDAVYHTSIVFNQTEHFFGAGVQTCPAGATHHGQPIEIVSLGQTHLPLDTIYEYLDALRQTYTPESYDLFAHNCNNFSHDFALFLVGRGIPEKITSLPATVLNTPMGRMFKAQIDQAMRPITTAPIPTTSGSGSSTSSSTPKTTPARAPMTSSATSKGPLNSGGNRVHNVATAAQLTPLLEFAQDRCAIIFFTSANCAPCRGAYPLFGSLAAKYGERMVFIKIDISTADSEVVYPYGITATPTFVPLYRGQQRPRWQGANLNRLRQTVEELHAMLPPPHPHTLLEVPDLMKIGCRPVRYANIPDLTKLRGKLGDVLAQDPAVNEMIEFLTKLQTKDIHDTPLPDLHQFTAFLEKHVLGTNEGSDDTGTIRLDQLFVLYDLLRIAFRDARVTTFFVESQHLKVLYGLINKTSGLGDKAPYSLRLITLQLVCNCIMPATPLTAHIFANRGDSSLQVVGDGKEAGQEGFVQLFASLAINALLNEEHATVRLAGARVLFNLSLAHHFARRTQMGLPSLSERDGVRDVNAMSASAFAPSQSSASSSVRTPERHHLPATLIPSDIQLEIVAAVQEAIDRQTEGRSIGMAALVAALGLMLFGSRHENGDDGGEGDDGAGDDAWTMAQQLELKALLEKKMAELKDEKGKEEGQKEGDGIAGAVSGEAGQVNGAQKADLVMRRIEMEGLYRDVLKILEAELD